MNTAKTIDKQKEELLRMREKLNSLQDENSALKQALADKDAEIAEMERRQSEFESKWEQHLTTVSEAVEEAAEAKLAYEQAQETASELNNELKRLIKSIKKNINGKAV